MKYWKLSAVALLVGAVGCTEPEGEEHPANNNSWVTNNASANNTTTPTNNATTPANNATTPTNNATTPANNQTANNATTPVNNMTSPPANNMTSPPANNMTSPPTNNTTPAEVSYYTHISPLFQEKCQQCHTDGGIAPFKLETYSQVSGLGMLISTSLESERMPPWPPAKDCGDFKHDRSLTTEQIEMVKTWVSDGMLEGDPADEVIIPDDPAMNLGMPDVVLDIGTDYKPAPPETEFDDYRCFVVDPGLTEDVFLNAFETEPGNDSIVHHVLMYAVEPDQHDRLAQLEASEPETPGYTCFGGPRAGDPALLGGWVPGTVPIQFEPGHGIRITKDAKIVVQIHYNTINDAVGTDRTKINLHFADTMMQELQMYPIADTNLAIQPGDANAQEGASFDIPAFVPDGFIKVYGVVPHMHELGRHIKVHIERDGAEMCMVDIPEWDFNWQGFYLYDSPVLVNGGDKISLSCEFDNSMGRNQQLGREPQMVQWGEGTRDEMCLNYVITNKLPI